MDRTEIEELLKKNKAFLAKEYNVCKIGLFGSYGRNEQTEKSDVDILVEFSGPIGFKFAGLKHYLESLFNRPVDLSTAKALKPRFKDIVLSEVRYQ